MKFYNRENELALLQQTRLLSEQSARMTFIVGRRRIGKTSLVLKAFEKTNFIYLFVARKNEALLCKEFTAIIENTLQKKVFGEFSSFSALFEYLLSEASLKPFTLIIDEFQEFYHVNPSVFSDMQRLWDQNKASSKMNLVLSGSVFSLMKKIFENAREPLFGRANERIHLKPFSVEVLQQILSDMHPGYRNDDLLAFFTITGGVAKYTELFADKKAFTLQRMLGEIFRENSLLIDEGKNLLIEEFGKDYTTYFSILSLIASSKTSRSDIESILGKNIGGYLDRLENEYQIIKAIRPINAKPGSRNQKYLIEDNFLSFWFRFVYKYRSAIEIGNFSYVKQIVQRDFETYSGQFLEKYFREMLAATNQYAMIGRYWERGNQNEIDIAAIDELNRKITLAEVKRNKKRIDLQGLEKKAENLLIAYPGYKPSYLALALEDMVPENQA
ncbi:MAG: ATP-binding protein [Mariniphaga sp.]|nr:ATP-binding protein [Mariniphaga sp.]